MEFAGGFIALTEEGERVGSHDRGSVPNVGDLLILRHPDDNGPTWVVVRREFVNGEPYVIVREGDQADSAVAKYARAR
jgi:hypothetical protein